MPPKCHPLLTIYGKDTLTAVKVPVRHGQPGKGIEGIACVHPFPAAKAGIAMLSARDRLRQGRGTAVLVREARLHLDQRLAHVVRMAVSQDDLSQALLPVALGAGRSGRMRAAPGQH